MTSPLHIINSDELCIPPEVCGPNAEDSKEEHLIAQTTDDNDSRVAVFLKRDKQLLRAIAVMVLLMNIEKLSHVLYPFKIFSTWIHELSHGTAAIMVGGGIDKILIYPDTSGLAWTYTDGSSGKRGFVASAGYTGTAVLGMILLLFRRTHRGPTCGIIAISVVILLSCMLYVRNTFALFFLPIMALVLIFCAWKLKAKYVGYLYSFLAATCSFNAIDNISELFGSVGYVNGQEATSDAHTVAEYWGGDYKTWAALWFVFALVCSVVGLMYAFDGLTYKKDHKIRDIESPSENPAFTAATNCDQQRPKQAIYKKEQNIADTESPSENPCYTATVNTDQRRQKTLLIY